MSYIRIEDLEHLKKLSKDEDGLDCFVALNGGARSSKLIKYHEDTNTFEIYHFIDDSEDVFDEEEFKKSFVYMALNRKALYKYA